MSKSLNEARMPSLADKLDQQEVERQEAQKKLKNKAKKVVKNLLGSVKKKK